MSIPGASGVAQAPDSVFISGAALETIEANAYAEAPLECCGLLLGRFTSPQAPPDEGGFSIPLPDVLTVEDAVPTRNASPEPTRYLVEPEDHFRILREARRRGLEIVGAYHSHVITQPVPSERDRAEAHPHFLYVIASPDWDTGEGCAVRAWWLVDGNFQELAIVPVP